MDRDRNIPKQSKSSTCLIFICLPAWAYSSVELLKRFLSTFRDRIFDSNVDRGIPRFAAAPEGPDFRVLEALLHKGPLPVNTIGPKVHLTPGSISVAVDRLLEKGLVSRVESSDDRRVRIVALTKAGRDLIVPIFRKHSAEIGRVFADATSKELQVLESILKKAGKRAKLLAEANER